MGQLKNLIRKTKDAYYGWKITNTTRLTEEEHERIVNAIHEMCVEAARLGEPELKIPRMALCLQHILDRDCISDIASHGPTMMRIYHDLQYAGYTFRVQLDTEQTAYNDTGILLSGWVE